MDAARGAPELDGDHWGGEIGLNEDAQAIGKLPDFHHRGGNEGMIGTHKDEGKRFCTVKGRSVTVPSPESVTRK